MSSAVADKGNGNQMPDYTSSSEISAGATAAGSAGAIPGAPQMPSSRPSVPPQIWAERLRAAGGQFRSAFLPLEPLYLATGERLRDLRAEVAALSDKADAAAALLSSGEFAALLTGLTEAVGHIDTLASHRDGLVETLGGMISSFEVMNRSLAVLGRVMFHIRVLAVNARIESAQIETAATAAAGTDFSVFIRGILEVARTGEQTLTAVRRELDSLKGAATRARDGQRAFEEQGLAELDALAGRLRTSIDHLLQRQDLAGQGVRAIPDYLLELSSRIGGLVSNLQAYDVVRQRLEHQAEGREDAATMIETGAVPHETDPLNHTPGGAEDLSDLGTDTPVRLFVNAVADLQALQMLHTADEYHQVVADVGRNLTAMANGVPELGRLCAQAFDRGEGALSLLEIETDLEKACALLRAFETHRRNAGSNLTQVTEAAARAGALLRRLNAIQADMRLMGLNASIKCGNLGGLARALNVIAQELQGYAALTQGHVETIVSGLGAVIASARDLGGSGQDSRQASQEALKATLDQTVLRLKQTGTAMAGLLNEIATIGPRVVLLTHEAERGFSGRADCREAAEQSIRDLTALAATTAPGQEGSALEELRADVLSFVESRYTMASERIVHNVIAGRRPAAGETAAPAMAGPQATPTGSGVESEPDISDILF